MKQNILKLTTAAFVGLFATSAHATQFTQEEWEAFINLKPSLVKKIAHEVEDAGGSDAFEQILGTGGLDVIKTRIGVGGVTGADVDLDAQIDRIEGGNPTLKDALDHAKALINSGVAANTLLQDIQAEADRANGAPNAASLHAGITAALANPGAIAVGTFAKVIAGTNAVNLDGNLDAEIARIDATPAASINAATTGVIAVLHPGSGAGLLADVNAEIVIADAASGAGPSADLHAAVATLAGAVPVAGTLHKVTAGTTAASLSGDLDAQIARLNNPAPVSIEVGMDAAEVLVPVNGATLVQNLGTIKGTIGAGADLPTAVTAAIATIDGGVQATIPLAVAAAVATIDVALPVHADIPTAVGAAAPKINAGSADIPAAIAAARTLLINRLNGDKSGVAPTLDLTTGGLLQLDVGGDVDLGNAANTVAVLLQFINAKHVRDL